MNRSVKNSTHEGRVAGDRPKLKPVDEVWLIVSPRLNSGDQNARVGYARHVASKIGLPLKLFGTADQLRDQSSYAMAIECMRAPEKSMQNWTPEQVVADYMKRKATCPKLLLTPGGEADIQCSLKEKPLPFYVSDARPEPQNYDGNGTNFIAPVNHTLTHESMEQAKVQAEKKWGDRSKPCIMVNCAEIEGAHAGRVTSIVRLLRGHTNATLLVTPSPRTKKADYDALLRELKKAVREHQGAHLQSVRLVSYHQKGGAWGEKMSIQDEVIAAGKQPEQAAAPMVDNAPENPYEQWLALADAVVVLGKSHSMMSEAAMTGKPVYYTSLSQREERNYTDIFGEEGMKRYQHLPSDADGGLSEKIWDKVNVTEHYADMLVKEYKAFEAERTRQENHVAAGQNKNNHWAGGWGV